jgi:hypothetical protein
MLKKASGPIQKTALRQNAQTPHGEKPKKEPSRDYASLIHEPEVHQIEL